VAEAGQGQLVGPHGASGPVGRLEHRHRMARLGEPDRGGQAVRSGSDHDDVHATPSASWWSMLCSTTSP